MPLPQKSYFTLDEIIRRWQSEGCDRATLLEYARADLLVFAVAERNLGSHTIRRETDDHVITTEVTRMQLGGPAETQSIWYLRADDARRVLETQPGERAAVNGLFRRVERDRASGVGQSPPKLYAYEDLVVTRDERDRFEEAHEVEFPDTPVSARSTLRRLLKLCQRFPTVVQLLQRRFSDRAKVFDMADEYDMQDLMHGLLAIEFDDIRAEDSVPSRAGGNSRLDFLLYKEEIGFELKMTRDGLKDKDVGAQLIVDIARYRANPRVRTLVCLVYDPSRKLVNPKALESELSGIRDGLEVHVLVVT